MIYVRIEMWPKGDRAKARVIGEGTITNVGGDADTGTYAVELKKSPEYATAAGMARDPIWKRGAVSDFPRLRLGPWDLLFRALRATVGERNR